jgi:predicted enzyme related to lactoylglutathione lyase
MLKKVAFTMYPVTDLGRARNFYEQILNLKATAIYPQKAGGSWIEYDLSQGGCFAITGMIENIIPSSSSGGSIAFEVDDLDRLVSELKEKNVEFKLDNIVTPVCKMAVILDSEGNVLTLHQLTKSW